MQEEKKYLIIKKNDKKIINQTAFLKLLKILHFDEGGNLQKIYMTTHYRNYDKLKKIMDANQNNFTQVLNDFLGKLKMFNNQIRNNNLDKKYWSNEKDFIKKLMKVTDINLKISDPNDIQFFINEYCKIY